MKLRWQGLRVKILAWSFVPTVIVLGAIALVNFYAYQQVTEDLVTSRNKEVARLLAGQLATGLEDYVSILNGLARAPEIYKGTSSDQRAFLQQSSNRLVVFDAGVVVLDAHGKVVVAESDRPSAMGEDLSDSTFFRQLLRLSRPVFSDILFDGSQGANVIVVAVPITGDKGEFVGSLAGMFKLGVTSVSSFYGGIVKLRAGGNGSNYVVDSRGRVIYHSDEDLIGKDLSLQPVVQQVSNGNVGNMRTTGSDGEAVMAAFAPVPGTPWGLVVEESWDDLMSSSRGYQQGLLLLLSLGVLIPSAFVIAGVRRITRPIEDLTDAAREVAQGNFGRVVTVETGDEMEELAKHFNLMSNQLQEYYSGLERKVYDRTRELSTLNAISSVVSRSLDLQEILQDSLAEILETMKMEAGAALCLDETGQHVVHIAWKGLSEEIVQSMVRLSLEDNARGLVANTGQPLFIKTADLAESELKALLEREAFTLMVSVPLMAKGKVLGIMNLATLTPRPLSPEELSLLANIGHQIGVAVENAQLYERAEESAAAAERSRLARELHDAVTQVLFSASLIAEVLPRIWERNPEEGRRRLEDLRQLTRGALAEMRTLLLELRPAALEEATLEDLLRQLAEAIIGRGRIPISLTVEGDCEPDANVKIVFYRIAQEALNNVVKHAGATQVMLDLQCQPDSVELVVKDNGSGFNPEAHSSGHLGLGIMQERARAVGAILSVISQPGQGTQVRLTWHRTE